MTDTSLSFIMSLKFQQFLKDNCSFLRVVFAVQAELCVSSSGKECCKRMYRRNKIYIQELCPNCSTYTQNDLSLGCCLQLLLGMRNLKMCINFMYFVSNHCVCLTSCQLNAI